MKERKLGKKLSPSHIKNLSISKIGNKNRWKGGKKFARMRAESKRRSFKFIALNGCEQDGWVGHHLDHEYVIFIPEELHRSVWHSVTKNKNMDIINDKVYEWFIKYYGLI